jgi:protein-S-isoprenylcysteine O-methyltransferase Ste14
MPEPPMMVYSEAVLFWAAFIGYFVLESVQFGLSWGKPAGNQDAGTRSLIFVADNLAVLLGFVVAWLPWLRLPYPRVALNAGTACILLGVVLRQYCFRTLGKYFTGNVRVVADQPVIDKGPYRWIRHPGYTAGFIVFLGMGLGFGSALSVAIILIEDVLVCARRVKVEEQALITTLGEPYRAYMQRTKRFVPFLF